MNDKLPPALAKAGLTPLVLALAACASEPIDPSRGSAFLQDQLIPRMIEWGKSRLDALPLGPLLAPQGFERICTAAQYMRLDEIEAEIPGIQSYRGSVSAMVPENRIAVIAIKGKVAHVGYVRTAALLLRNRRPACSGIEQAVLRRLPDEHPEGPGNIPDVLLEAPNDLPSLSMYKQDS